MTGIWLYIIILVLKMIEVSLATLRIVLITKDERVKGAFIAFFEVILWVFLVATVLDNITGDPIKVLVYALGFALGNFLGSKIENYLAIGNTNVEVITHRADGKKVSLKLRNEGYAVTEVSAKGMNDKRVILYVRVPRKQVKPTVKLIQQVENDVVITINDIKPVYGGYRMMRK